MQQLRRLLVIVALSCPLVGLAENSEVILDIESWNSTESKLRVWTVPTSRIDDLATRPTPPLDIVKAIGLARQYLRDHKPKAAPSPLDPLATIVPLESAKRWKFVELRVKEIDLGRTRGTLISWTPQPTGVYYYSLCFVAELEGDKQSTPFTIAMLPDLTIVPLKDLPATETEIKQMKWWNVHMESSNDPVNRTTKP